MNNLKKKWLNLYTTLTMYQNAYRLKSGFLAGITGLCACNIPLENSSLETLSGKETISQVLEDKEDYYDVLVQIILSQNDPLFNNNLFKEIDSALNITSNYNEEIQNLLKIIINEGDYTKVKEKCSNLWIELQNENNNQFLQIINYGNFESRKIFSQNNLVIVLKDGIDLTYEREFTITVSENQCIKIALKFYDQKGNILNYPCLYQMYYTENSKNLVMMTTEPTIAEDDTITYEQNGMNYNVTGNEYMVFKTIVESYFNKLFFEDVRNILKEYILNYEELPISNESILITNDELKEKNLQLLR